MAFIIKDRVKENTTSTGTGAITLGGAAATFDPFNSYMSNGDTTYYAIVHTASGVDEWEVGIGTWNTGNTLTRTTVLAGSNGASAVDFSAGTKDIFMTYPASKAVYTDASGDIDINGGTIDGTTIGANSHTTGKFTTLQATGNVDFDGYIDMNPISHPTHSEGRVYYDSAHKSLSYQSDISDVEHEIGLEEHVRVYNNSGSTIAKGKPVYWSGNQNDVPTIGLANATSETKYNVQGLTAGSIANNSYGYVIVSGLVYDIDTSSLNAGENFFAGLTDGALQNASPTYPNFPMCLGWVIKSDATTGIVLVNQQNHSVNSFRVRTDAHVGGDLTVSGDLTVTGTQTTASSSNVELGASFQYLNAGDTIGESGTTQSTGSGLDDATFVGHFTGTASTTYYVKIDATGTPDTFSWSKDNFSTTEATGVSITGNDQTLDNGIKINFGATTGHTLNDVWSGTAAPANVDTGLFTNYNTGGSGVGYTHTGIFWDADTAKWTVLSEYDPEPEGTINLSDSSVAYATFKAGTFEGDLTGDVTGDVTGTATSANALATARTIGGVSFDGTANINLPGVNTTGNQDTTGNAATATALETSRTIQLTGDVTGSATFDGSANASITAVVQDDSHSHVISNVDGLQSALDAKADDTTTITAGNGLTGGGSLGANRTFNVGAGGGISVTADAVAHADTSSQASVNNSGNTFIQDVTLDTYGHVTGLTSSTVTVGDGDITVNSGGGLTGSGTFSTNQSGNETITLSHADTSSQASVNGSGRTYIQDITLDGYGHVTAIGTATETVVNTNQLTTFQVEDGDGTEVTISHGKEWKFVEAGGININWTDTSTGSDGDPYDLSFSINTGVTAGNGLTGGGTLNATRTLNVGAGSGITVSADAVAHADTSTQASVNNSGRTYIQDITLDGFGHVTGLTSATETVTDTTYSAGSGLSLSGTTFSHTDTSSQASVNNSGGIVIQDITLDTYGHITGINSVNLDGRYYTESEADSRFVRKNVGYIWTGTGGSALSFMSSNTIDTATGDQAALEIYQDNSGEDAFIQFHIAGDYGKYLGLHGGINDFVVGGWSHGSSYQRLFHDGYHPNADKWTTARTLSLSGDASGSVSWDGSANATLSVTVANDSHTHDGRYYTESEADNRFLRSDTSDTFTTLSGTQLNLGSQVQLAESSDRADLLQITSSTSGWAGLQIRNSSNEGRWSFMTDGSVAGIYDDENGDWHVQWDENGASRFYHNGTERLAITSSGIDVSSHIYIDENIYHNGDTNTYIGFHANDQWRVVTGGSERLEVNSSQITSTEPIHAPSFHGSGASLTGIVAAARNGYFWENDQTITSNQTITNGKNAMSAGPITINSGVTVTVGTGEAWTVV